MKKKPHVCSISSQLWEIGNLFSSNLVSIKKGTCRIPGAKLKGIFDAHKHVFPLPALFVTFHLKLCSKKWRHLSDMPWYCSLKAFQCMGWTDRIIRICMEKIYQDCSKSNASDFVLLVHDIRGKWWYGSRGWTFPPVFCHVLLPCDRWQQRGSLTQWCLSWKCIWCKSVKPNSSMQKKWHPLTFVSACWMFMETKQWVWVWCVSAVATAMWNTSHALAGHADLYEHDMQALVHCWWKCITNAGNYVEK